MTVGTALRDPRRFVIVAAAAAIVLSALALVGAALRVTLLTTLVPGGAPLQVNAAFGLLLSGTALLALAGLAPQRREAGVAALAVMVIVASSAMPISAAAALAGAAATLFLIAVQPGRRAVVWIRRGLAVAVLVAGTLGVLGYAGQVSVLYTWSALSAMALPMAIGVLALGAGLLVLERIHEPLAVPTEDQRIARVAALALVLAAATTGLAGVAALEFQARRSAEGELQSQLNALVGEITTNLDLRSSRAAIITTRPNLRRHLRVLAGDPTNAAAREIVQDVLGSFLAHDFTRLVARTPSGEIVGQVGDEAEAATPAFEVPLRQAGAIRLVWREGPLLRHELALRDAAGPLGTVIAEQQLPRMSELLRANQTRFTTSEFLLCDAPPGQAVRCFPTRLSPTPVVVRPGQPGDPRLVERALEQGAGVTTGIDYRGRAVLGAYTPVPGVGLAAVLKVEVDELYGPIRRQLVIALILVVGAAAVGVVLVRARVGPLAARLEARVRTRTAQLEHVSARMAILHEIDRGLLAAQAPQEIAENTLRPLRNVLGVPRVIVFLVNLHAGEVEWLAAAGRRRLRVGPGVRYSIDLMGDLAALRRGVPQVMDVEGLPPGPDTAALAQSGVRFYVVVPMLIGGELIGGLSFGGPTRQFSPEQMAIAEEVARQMAIVIEHARLNESVRRHAAELEERVRERTAALEAAQEELVRKERLAILGQLAGSVAHDLRHPLGVIKNAVYFLRLTLAGSDDARVRKHLAIVDREIEISNRVITEMLDFARAPAPTRVRTDLNAIVYAHAERMGRPADTVALVHRLAADLPPVEADPVQLGQVLDNLVRNAEQAMPEGGRLTIETAREDDGRVMLAVSDTGAGIAPEALPRIFEPLFTTKAKGVGLGLAIVKRLAEANGAVVDVESEPGHGSRFRLLFG